MKKPINLLMLCGWGMLPEVLQPLQNALIKQGFAVTVQPIFNPYSAIERQPYQGLAQAADVLVGWSLGGQLAMTLAYDLQQYNNTAKPVITLASNACFTQQEGWPEAMLPNTLHTFVTNFVSSPEKTLNRFVALMTKGDIQAKALHKALQPLIAKPSAQLVAGLNTLAQWDGREILRAYSAKQLHIFAQYDALVPEAVAKALILLNSNMQVRTIADGSHAFVYTHANVLANEITQWIN